MLSSTALLVKFRFEAAGRKLTKSILSSEIGLASKLLFAVSVIPANPKPVDLINFRREFIFYQVLYSS
jgi:hypothetical protein